MQISPPMSDEMPNSVLLGLGLLTIPPVFFAFQTDSHVLAVLAVTTALAGLLWLLRQFASAPYVLLTMGITIGVSAVAMLVTRNAYLTTITIAWLIVGVMSFWLLSSWAMFSDTVRRGSWLLAITQAALAISGIWTFFKYGQRATGWATNANGLGGILLFGVLLLLVLVVAKHRRRWTVPAFIMIAIGWALTISLTAFVAAIIPLLVFCWWYRKSIAWKPVLIVGAIGIVGMITVWMTSQPKKLVDLMTGQHVSFSFTQRLEFDRVALRMWQAKPWTGWGLGTYRQTFPRYTHQYNEQPLYTHNVYLQVLAESGIVGGLGWLAIVIVVGWLGWRQATRVGTSVEAHMFRGLYLGWLAFTLHAAVDFSWHFPAGLVWWLFVTAIIIQRNRNVAPNTRPVWQVAVLAPLSLVLLIGGGVVLVAVQASDRGQTAMHNQNDATALAEFERAVRYRGSTEDLQDEAQVYWVRRQGDDLKKGESLLRQALRHNQDNYHLHNALGHNLAAQQRHMEALGEYQIAARLDPLFHPQYSYDYIMSLIKNGQADNARRELKMVLQRYTNTASPNPIVIQQLPMLEPLRAQLLPDG